MHGFLRALIWLLLLGLLASGAALFWVLPAYARLAVRDLISDAYLIGGIDFKPPARLILQDVRLSSAPGQAAAGVGRIAIDIEGLDWIKRTVWVGLLFEEPSVRLWRSESGAVSVPLHPLRGIRPGGGAYDTQEAALPSGVSDWRVRVRTVRVVSGAVEWVDERFPKPYRGLLQHIFLTASPGLHGTAQPPLSFAMHAQWVGLGGHSAPLYCSGWLGVADRNVEASCRLEPIATAAFESYLSRIGKVQVRLYEAAVSGTTHWQAYGNRLDGRFQVQLDNLTQGDLSMRGHTILDFATLTRDNGGKLISEIRVMGLLDDPSGWQWECTPGTDLIQQHIRTKYDRAKEVVSFRLLGQKVGLLLVPVSREFVDAIEHASREVRQALEAVSSPLLSGDVVLNPGEGLSGPPSTVAPAP